MMIHGQSLSFNHHIHPPLTTILIFKNNPASSLITFALLHGINGIWLGNYTRTWSSSSTHIELVNFKDIFSYLQNFPKTSTCKQSCGMIATEESNWQKKGNLPYWIANYLWKGSTLLPRRLEYNTYPDNHTLITAHQTLGLLPHREQYFTKESRF